MLTSGIEPAVKSSVHYSLKWTVLADKQITSVYTNSWLCVKELANKLNKIAFT